MVRHQSLILAVAAGVISALVVPIEPSRALVLAAPALWVMAWIGYCRDRILAAIHRLTVTIGGSEQRITEHIDIAAADTIIAIHKAAPNQRTGAYDRPGAGLRSV
jgi:hypothetical protein